MKISAISVAMGGKCEKLANINEKRLEQFKKNYGMQRHYVSLDDEYASDLALRAVNGLKKSGASLDGVDCILFVSHTPDFLAPAMSSLIHKELGLRADVFCLDITSFCSGFLKGLFVANELLARFKKVLLVCVSVKSKALDKNDIFTYFSISDSASGCLIEASDTPLKYAELMASDLACVETLPYGGYKGGSEFLSINNSSFFNEVFTHFVPFFKDFCSKLSFKNPLYFLNYPSQFFANRIINTLGLNKDDCINLALQDFANADINNLPLNLALYGDKVKNVGGGG